MSTMSRDVPKLNQIYHGDCIKVMKSFPSSFVDLIFADPPYNLSGSKLQCVGNTTGGDWFKMNEVWDTMGEKEYIQFTHDWISECKRLLKDSGSIYICCTYHNIGELMMTLKSLDFKCLNIITWYKANSMPSMTKRQFTHACEYILYFAKGKGWTFNYEDTKKMNPEKTKDGKQKQMRDFWKLPLCQGAERLKGTDGRSAHPTQKPEVLVERAIRTSSCEGQIVLDPFLGSGTTALAAQHLHRKWIGLEANSSYVKLARGRLKFVK